MENPVSVPAHTAFNAVNASLTAAAAAALLFAAPAAEANSPNQANLSGVSLLAVAAGGNGTGGFGWGGDTLFIDPPNPGGYGTFRSGSYDRQVVNAGTALVTQSFSLSWPSGNPPVNLPYSGNAKASASFSKIKVFATEQGATSVLFPTAAAQAGWTDQLTIVAPGQSGAGLLDIKLHVEGDLSADNGARPGFSLTPYVNHNLVGLNASFNAANPTPVIGSLGAVGAQTREWWLPANGNPVTLHVDEFVDYSLPFTFGQTFSMGLYAEAIAGNGSYSGGPTAPVSHATSEFSHTVSWAGIGGVTAGGSAVGGYTVSSASGTDWKVSAVPEPGSAAMLLAGLAGMVFLRRRRD